MIVLHVYPNAKKLVILHEKVLSENTSTRISLLQSPSSNNLIKNDVEIKLVFHSFLSCNDEERFSLLQRFSRIYDFFFS